MENMYTNLIQKNKESIYRIYCKVVNENELDFNELTNKKMVKKIIDTYEKTDYLFYALSQEELDYLESLINGNPNENMDKVNLIDNFILNSNGKIYVEIKEILESTIKKARSKDGKRLLEISEICIGICNAYGAIYIDDYFDLVESITGINDVEDLLISNYFFANKVKKAELEIEGNYECLIIYPNIKCVDAFLQQHPEVLLNDIHIFTDDEYIEFAKNGALVSKSSVLRELIKILHRNFNISDYNKYMKRILYAINTSEEYVDMNTVQKEIYCAMPKSMGAAQDYIDIYNATECLKFELSSWISRGRAISYGPDKMLLGDEQDQKLIEECERMFIEKNGVFPEDAIEEYIEFLKEVFDEDDRYDMEVISPRKKEQFN